tara:strand:+ start:22 stop:984 length:963 start_codon:yes stop_codon:yes gene_type:complete
MKKNLFIFFHQLYLIQYHFTNRKINKKIKQYFKKIINRFLFKSNGFKYQNKYTENYNKLIDDNMSSDQSLLVGPINYIPKNLIEDFSLNNTIPVLYSFQDDSIINESNWSGLYFLNYCKRFTNQKIYKNKHGEESYPGTSRLICKSIQKYNIKNKNIAIIGSQTPWIEAIMYNNQCNSITTVEYNVPQFSGHEINTISYLDFVETDNKYDMIITFSSIEHSGLGRYGDILDPSADFKTMENIYSKLKSDGLLFLGVPIGKDVLVWNMHRVYGEIRLPLLLKKFKLIDWYGTNPKYISKAKISLDGKQPLMILKKIVNLNE